jgi:DNA-binding SARP family transcriptional activator
VDSAQRLVTALGLDQRQAAELLQLAAGSADRVARGLRVSVLGPLAAYRDGLPLALGAGMRRAVLGMLALHEGIALHREAFVDVLWEGDPPATAALLIQSHIRRLRGLLGPGQSGPRIITVGASYLLEVAASELDVIEFAGLASRADDARADGEYSTACELYARALGLWRGEPLADVDILRGHPAVIGLGQRRTEVVLKYAEAASAAGWHELVLPHLYELTHREPLNERAHAQLMIALAGDGQQAAAFGVYEDVRRRLAAELGVDPGAEVSAAHSRVLRQQVVAHAARPARTGPAARHADHAGHPLIPRQLPSATRYLVGREAELGVLARLARQARGNGGAAVICAIGGSAGIGKTTLAVHFAHQVARRFGDGQLYVNLHGFGPSKSPVTPAEALRGFLGALGVAPQQIPQSEQAQEGLYRSLLAGKRLLVLLDNARDEERVRPLLPGSSGSLVIVTSRNQLAGLAATDGATLLTLDVLTPAEARDLLASRIGIERTAAEAEAVDDLARLCALLPLALSIAAARAVADEHLPVAAVASGLRQARNRLDALSAGDPASSVPTVFSWSYQNLGTSAARMFRLLGIHPGPDISIPAAASLAGVPDEQARDALSELAHAHLISQLVPGRFTCHDLLRTYAAERARAIDDAEETRAATHRMLDHYLHAAHAGARLLHQGREPLTLDGPCPGVTPERLGDHEEALAWFKAEHEVLLAAIELAVATGFDTHAWQLPWTLVTYLYRRGHWDQWASTQRTALAAARRQGDRVGQARAHVELGYINTYVPPASYQEAVSHLEQALALYRELGDRAGQARVHNALSNSLEQRGHLTEALGHAEESLALYQTAGTPDAYANALNMVGWLRAQLGDYERGLRDSRRAFILHREARNRHGEADSWTTIGYAHSQLGSHRVAIISYERALTLRRELGDRHNEASILGHMGDAYHAAGNLGAARNTWQEAMGVFDDLRHPDAAQMRARIEHLAGTFSAFSE